MGSPGETHKAATPLASDDSSFIAGIDLVVEVWYGANLGALVPQAFDPGYG